MIRYNFRQRGAFEYDKFALNFLQLNNEVNKLNEETISNEDLISLKKEIDNTFDVITGEKSLSSELNKIMLMLK